MKQDISSFYVPIPSSQDLFVHLIHHSENDGIDSDLSLRCLLNGSYLKDATSMFIFEAADYGLFLLWAARTKTTSTNTLDDALIMSQDFIEGTSQRQICVLFNPEREHGQKLHRENSSILAVLARYDQELQSSLGIPLVQQEKIARPHQIAKCAGRATSLLRSTDVIVSTPLSSRQLLCISGVITCVLIVLALSAKYLIAGHSPDKYHSWMAYDTHGSIGPKYQLSLTGQNVSEWSSYIHNDGEWVLRIDDQAIIPLHLMDEEEKHYQEWYRNHYPEVNQIRLNLDYLNETWLSSPSVDQVPVDDLFHLSHCVLALRRYIKAKETGRHVCGRDIDHDHMTHCLDALDWWAFPSGERTETIPNPQRPFWWRTKVCFD